MLKFMFVLTFFTPDGSYSTAMDTGISGQDCVSQIEEYMSTNPNLSTEGYPSCEIDMVYQTHYLMEYNAVGEFRQTVMGTFVNQWECIEVARDLAEAAPRNVEYGCATSLPD